MKKLLVFLALLAFVLTGCSALKNLLMTTGELSENYALEINGGKATSPQMNDGSLYTGDKTKPLAAVRDKYWQEKEKFSQATITLREPKRINKIKIFSEDLDVVLGGMKAIVEYLDKNGKWKVIREYKTDIPKNIIVNTNIITDNVRLWVRRPSGMFGSGGGATGGAALKDKGERTIKEFELFGKIQKPESQKEEKANK